MTSPPHTIEPLQREATVVDSQCVVLSITLGLAHKFTNVDSILTILK